MMFVWKDRKFNDKRGQGLLIWKKLIGDISFGKTSSDEKSRRRLECVETRESFLIVVVFDDWRFARFDDDKKWSILVWKKNKWRVGAVQD